MKNKFKMIAFLLCITLIFPLFSQSSAWAIGEDFSVAASTEKNVPTLEDYLAGVVTPEELYGSLAKASVPEIVGYDNALSRAHVKRLSTEEGEDLNRLVFQNADGSKTIYVYDHPVKYKDETGKIKDITLEIQESAKAGQFETASGGVLTTFSSQLSEGISLRGNQVSISLVPQLEKSAEKTELSSLSKAKLVNQRKVVYPYDSKTEIEYALTYTGFKENIVVKEYTGKTHYNFTLYTGGLKLIEDQGSFCLVDSKKTVKAVLGDIIIFTADERNNTMGEMVAETVVENQEYVITIVVDKEWLSDPNTKYPIRIDPTVEICYDNNGDGAISDVTINSLQGSSGTSGSLYIGKRETYGISRVLMKFPGLNFSNLGSNITITNATVSIRDLLGEVPEMGIDCHIFTGNTWSEDTANWNNTNPNSYVSAPMSSRVVSYATGQVQSEIYRFDFDITAAVAGWKAGSLNQEKGILFKATNTVENGSGYLHKTFASYNRSSYQKPYLSITYTEDENLLNDTTYYINNSYSGKYLRYASGQALSVQSGLIANLADTIRWEIRAVAGGYVIRSKADPTRFLGVPYGNSSSSLVQVMPLTESATIPAECIWIVTGSSVGGVLIKNTANSRYLATNGSSLYTSATASSSDPDTIYQSTWRVPSISYYGDHTSTATKRELQSGFSVSCEDVDVGDTIYPTITVTPSNALWATSRDFIYSSIFESNVSINGNTMVATNSGSVTVTATHKVTGYLYEFAFDILPGTFDVYIFSSGMSFANSSADSKFGHAWIQIISHSAHEQTIGHYTLPAGEEVTIGRWKGTSDEDDPFIDFLGIWYNRELYEYYTHEKYMEYVYSYTTVGKTVVNQISAEILSSYNGYDFDENNCVHFAVTVWNMCVEEQDEISTLIKSPLLLEFMIEALEQHDSGSTFSLPEVIVYGCFDGLEYQEYSEETDLS